MNVVACVRLAAVLLVSPLLQCAGPADDDVSPVAVQAAPLVRDEAHQGRSGFLFLPPLYPQVAHSGEFEARLAPEVQIDKVDEQGVVRSHLATFTAVVTRESQTVAVMRNPGAEYYVARWRVTGNIMFPDRVRARVVVGGIELGFLEFELVSSKARYDAFERGVDLPLLRGQTVTIKFWIAKHAVDSDGDGVFDWLDNCPSVPNPATQVLPAEVALLPQPVPEHCNSDVSPCDPNERAVNPATFIQPAGDCTHLTAGTGGMAGGDAGHVAEAGHSGAAGSGGAGGHGGMAGAATEAGHAGPAGSGGMGSMLHGPGPYIDTRMIPAGDPGISARAIRATDERSADSDGVGAFRTVCVFSHMNFDDPIVAPGRPNSAHLHVYFGNTLTDANSTAQSLLAQGNSTCRGGIVNRTAYWVPALIDASGTPLRPGDANIYYKTGYNGIDPQTVQPFPAGLRMIAGDARASGPQESAWWGCDKRYIGRAPTITRCGRDDRIVMTVVFPQCWDGVHLDSPDHKSHMAYPALGRCPSTHPVSVPEITFNIPYEVPATGVAGLRLASDMYDPGLPGGYSAHADWFDAWDPAVMAAWVRSCDQDARDCHSHLVGDGRELYYDRELGAHP